jgi:GxxExxY protein
VEEQVILELKAVRMLDDAHAAQALNYLRSTGFPVCLLVNFGRPRIEIKRLIPSNSWKSFKP